MEGTMNIDFLKRETVISVSYLPILSAYYSYINIYIIWIYFHILIYIPLSLFWYSSYIYIYIVLYGPVKPDLGVIPSGQENH